MKKIIFAFLSLFCFCFLNTCKKKEDLCKGFSTDEQAWMPYSDGEVTVLKNKNGTVLKITATKGEEKQKPHKVTVNKVIGTTKTTGCSTSVKWRFKSINYLNSIIELSNNNEAKGGYSFEIKIDDIKYTKSDIALNTSSKSINGVPYADVLSIIYFNKYNDPFGAPTWDTFYYGKNIGYIALHIKQSNEWFYKQ